MWSTGKDDKKEGRSAFLVVVAVSHFFRSPSGFRRSRCLALGTFGSLVVNFAATLAVLVSGRSRTKRRGTANERAACSLRPPQATKKAAKIFYTAIHTVDVHITKR